MGCTSSKQYSSTEEYLAKKQGRNRSRHIDGGPTQRHELTPPKSVEREDAFNHGRGSDNEPVPAGWSHRTVNDPTRSEAATGLPDRTENQEGGSSASGLPPAGDQTMNKVADHGDAAQRTQAWIDKSLATSSADEQSMKTNVNSFPNAKKADANRVVESRKMKTRLGVM
ncbi:hypothetical protein BR93DRAFT_966125 [Coniochaeta sp. PMI_546]|nr:hypothetical protein BR93DRAFT_966125 [Coniochaeta sp. PMI_546]